MAKSREKILQAEARYKLSLIPSIRYCGVMMVNGWEYCRLIDLRDGNAMNATVEIDQALKIVRFPWLIHAAIFGIEANGKKKMTMQVVQHHEPKTQLQIIDFQHRTHQELIDQWQGKEFIGFGWISSPYGYELDEESADQIFTMHGAWG